jgi:uncharacterized RDD family membrane protein YckC
MEANPYAAPTAAVEDVRSFSAGDLESRKAGRGQRLGAVILDGLINAFWAGPLIWAFMMSSSVNRGLKPAAPMVGLLLLGFAVLIGVLVINCVLLHRHGQTIGKRTLDIAIVRTDGSRVGLLRVIFLRGLPVSLLSRIPVIGPLVWLVDSLLIFGSERRCLHDLIADTIVIDV